MIGNQHDINLKLLNHPDCLIKDVGGVKAEHIIEIMEHEYWKEWKKQMRYSEKPFINCNGLGYFEINFSRGRKYIWWLIKRVRRNRIFTDKVDNPNTFTYRCHQGNMKDLRVVWKQMNILKHLWIANVKKVVAYYEKLGQTDKIKHRYE
jgi:hypothetical protein